MEKNRKWVMPLCAFIWMLSLSPALAGTDIPAEVKESLLIYPGAEITNVQKNVRGRSYSYDVDLQTGAPYAKVISFYRSEVNKEGMEGLQ